MPSAGPWCSLWPPASLGLETRPSGRFGFPSPSTVGKSPDSMS